MRVSAPGHFISEKIRAFFKHTGVLVYRHPHLFFWLPVLTTLASVAGLLRFHEENRIWYLYSPSGAPSHREHAIANEFFNDRGGKFWMEVSVTAHDMGSLLRPSYLDAIDSLSNFLQYNFSVPCERSLEPSGECSFASICSGSCNDNQVIPIFNLVYRNASQRLHPNFRLTYPTMHLYNDEYYVGEHFAGVQIDPNTSRISSVKVIVLYFRTDKQNDVIGDVLDRWEQEVIHYSANFDHPILNMTSNSDFLISQEVRRNGMTCIPYFTLSVAAVFFFILISNRREAFHIDHSIVMALLGILGPLMACLTTYCLLFLIGVPFNSITLVMPFLIIGVGADDVFIIIHACRKTNKKAPLEQQIAETMEEAGPSITITSATNMLSFAIGIATPTPAISLFCLYTCIAVFIDYIYQLTFFVAALVFEEMRQANKIHIEKPPIERAEDQRYEKSLKRQNLRNGLVTKYTAMMQKWQVRLVLLALTSLYWLAAIRGCMTMDVKMDTTHLILKDSPLNNIAWLYERFLWKEGQLVLIFVNSPPDLSEPANQRSMLSLVDGFERLPYAMGRNSTSFWLRHFLSQSSLYLDQQDFYPLLQQWMEDAESGGARWNDMVRLRRASPSNSSVVGVDKFMFATACAMGEESSWLLRAQLQRNWREEAARWPAYNVTVFQAYSFYVDQLDSVGSTTLSTVIVAAITMDLVCFFMIPSASSIITSSLAMLSINVGVFGFLSLWDVALDPITMCTTLMSIGFSVDFTAHISYHFYRNPEVAMPNSERLADALRCIGWPMVQAGTSTLLCILPIILVDSYMVGVFVKTIFLVITLGLLHGILLLPALLITVGCGTSEEASAERSVDTSGESKLKPSTTSFVSATTMISVSPESSETSLVNSTPLQRLDTPAERRQNG